MTKGECLNELNSWQKKLSQDPRVDITSFEERCKVVKDKLQKETPEDAADIVAELRAAADLLRIPDIEALKFGKFEESPDIEIQISEYKLGVEVRRYRPKVGPTRNEKATEEKLLAAPKEGKLVPYGDPQRIVDEIVEMIREKSEKCKSANYEWIFLYVLSDSRHYVEETEIHVAWKTALKEVSPLIFCGLLYHWEHLFGLLLNPDVIPPREVLVPLHRKYPRPSDPFKVHLCEKF